MPNATGMLIVILLIRHNLNKKHVIKLLIHAMPLTAGMLIINY
jgi:hypothetical protein